MSSAVRVRVEKLVTVLTQPLDAGGALSVHSRNPTDGADHYSDTKKKKKKLKNRWQQKKCCIPGLKPVVIWHTLFGFLYFISLVTVSGGVAVKEVITCIAEMLIVTRWADQRRRGTTQITVTRCRRAWRVRKKLKDWECI